MPATPPTHPSKPYHPRLNETAPTVASPADRLWLALALAAADPMPEALSDPVVLAATEVGVTVKTPPEGSCARQDDAAVEASCAVFGPEILVSSKMNRYESLRFTHGSSSTSHFRRNRSSSRPG
jgi:hypothetical protein